MKKFVDFHLVSGPVDEAKGKVNEMLGKGYELFGEPHIFCHQPTDRVVENPKFTMFQPMLLSKKRAKKAEKKAVRTTAFAKHAEPAASRS